RAPAATQSRLAAECARARVEPDRAGLGVAALSYGAALLQATSTVEALEALAEAESAARAAGDAAVRVQVTVFKSKALTLVGDLQGALETFGEGLELAKATGDRHTEGVLLCSLGYFHGQLEEAAPYEEYTRIALALFRELGDRERVALCLNNLAGAVAKRGAYDEALACYEEATPIALALGWRRGEALILGGQGGVRFRQGRVEEGTQKYLESNVILAEVGDAFQLARHLGLLGRALVEAERPSEALPHLEAALAHAERNGFEREVAQHMGLLSRVHEALGDAPAALRALRRHQQLGKATADRRTEEMVRYLKLEHRLDAARREADLQGARNAELAAANASLTAALQRQRELQEELTRLASTDALTGLRNRRAMQELGGREIARSRRTRRGLAVMMVDVDHFKRINDGHGHAAGDEVLAELARRLVANVRTVDLVARWGGEEFCVLLVETDTEGARITAERLGRATAQRPFQTAAGAIDVTLSIGISGLREGDEALAAVMGRADAALYAAKKEGRDRYVIWREGSAEAARG
ncbi:MAG: hypothetical protein JWM10_3345, partial [Myxococcaceae bacterium]|nr:hypothetical protein [Myxococcaceae bacterium]